MVSRVFGVLGAVLMVCCSPPPLPPPPPPPPPAPVAPLPPEPCSADGHYAPVVENIAELYDEFLEDKSKDIYEEDPYDPGDPKEVARHAALQGLQAYKEMRWDKAYQAFSAAWERLKHPYNALKLAEVSINLGYWDDAIFFAVFVDKSTQAKTVDREKAKKWDAVAREKVARLGVIVVPDGACITVDGLSVGNAPLSKKLPLVQSPEILVRPGTHRLKALFHGKVDEKVVTIEEGKTAEVTLTPQ